MAFPISSGSSSLTAQHQLTKLSDRIRDHHKKLSSGLRIGSAKDDAAGLAISERLRAQISGFSQSTQNVSYGISLAQTAESGLGQISDIVSKLKQLSVQAKNGTLNDADKQSLQGEADQLLEQIDQIAGSSDFNGVSLLDGSTTSVELDVGGGSGSYSIQLGGATASSLGLSGFDLDGAGSVDALDQALAKVSGLKTHLGAAANVLDHTVGQLNSQITALTEAESRIRDVDVAEESALLVQDQVKNQAALSIAAQANLQSGKTLSLLTSG